MTGLSVTVSGTLYGEPVSATRHPDGRVEGDTELLMLVGKLAERGTRCSYWPFGDTTATISEPRGFAITCAAAVEGPKIDAPALWGDEDEQDGEVY